MKVICVYNEKEDLLNVLFGKPDLEIQLVKGHETGCEIELPGELSRALWRCLRKTYSPNQIEILPIPKHYGYNVIIKNAMNREVKMSMYGVGDKNGRFCHGSDSDEQTKDAAWVLGSITESMCHQRACAGCPCKCCDEVLSYEGNKGCIAAFVVELDNTEQIKIL